MRKLVGLALGALLLTSPAARAIPTDPQTAAGSVTVQSSGSQMDVVQQTQQAILNWRSFSIAPGELVRILQPNAQAVLLSRVTGRDPSVLLGSLSATGRLFLLNPNGIFIGPGAQIQTAGLVASTLSLSDDDFLSGNYRLLQDPSLPQAAVVNQGEIRVTEGGFVLLAAPLVSNEGLIVARTGQVGLAAGTEVTVSFDSEGIMNWALGPGEVTPGPVLMPREQVSELLGRLVEDPNLVEAGAIVEEGGRIRLEGAGGVLLHSGSIGAESGRVRLDSTGTTVAAGSVVADGGSGDIRVLSDGLTVLSPSGHLSARGGQGFIEVSGDRFFLQGTTDVSGGEGGQVLIDPPVINIVNGAGGTLDPELPDILLLDPSVPPNTLSEVALEGVTSGTILLQGGQINIFDIADNEISLQPGVSLDIDGMGDFGSDVEFQDGFDRIATSGGGGFTWRVRLDPVVANLIAPGGTIDIYGEQGITLMPLNGGLVADTVRLGTVFGPLDTTGAEPPGTVSVTADTFAFTGRDIKFFNTDFLVVDVAHLALLTELGAFVDNIRPPVAGDSSLNVSHYGGFNGQDGVFWGPTGFLEYGLSGTDVLEANLPRTDLVMSVPRDVLSAGVTAASIQITSLTGQILDNALGADFTATTGILGLDSRVQIGSVSNPLEVSGSTVTLITSGGTLAGTTVHFLTPATDLEVRSSGAVTLTGEVQLDFSGGVLNGILPGDLTFQAEQMSLGSITSPGFVAIGSFSTITDANGPATNLTAPQVQLSAASPGAGITADVIADDLQVSAQGGAVVLNQGAGALDQLTVVNPGGSVTVGQDGSLKPLLEASIETDTLDLEVSGGSLGIGLIVATGAINLGATGDVLIDTIGQSQIAPFSVTAGGSILDRNGAETNYLGIDNPVSLSAGGSVDLDLVNAGSLTLDVGAANVRVGNGGSGVRLSGTSRGNLTVDNSDFLYLGSLTGQTVNLTSAFGLLDDESSSGRLSAEAANLVVGPISTGRFSQPLQLDVRNLTVRAESNAVAFQNLGDLNLIEVVTTSAQPLGGIELSTTGNLTVGLVESNADLERFVSLTAGGAILDGNGPEVNIRSPFSFAEAGGGNLGASDDPLEYEGGFLVGFSSDSLYVHAVGPLTRLRAQSEQGEVRLTSSGDMLLATTVSPTRIDVQADGNILDGNDDTEPRDNLIAPTGSLTAGGAIGQATDPIEVQLTGNPPGTLTATAGGSIDGVSVSVNLVSGGQLALGNTPPGAVVLNGSDILDPLAPSTANLLALSGSSGLDGDLNAGLIPASILAQNNLKLANSMEGVVYTYDIAFVVNAAQWLEITKGTVVWEDFDE